MRIVRSILLPTVLVLTLLLILAACGRQTGPAAARPLAVADMSADQKTQRARAEAARDALTQKLVGRLMAAMKTTGPVGAISVCKEAAPAISAAVGEEQGVRIGRTSFKLRNPANASPAWAQASVAARAAEPTWFALANGDLAGLMPIRIMQLCTRCHGDPAEMDAALLAALETHYPEDQATGFGVGDLRGWFWVEVPAKQ